jgi:hypothetical protein
MMEPKILRVGEHFINITHLLWAQTRPDGQDSSIQLLILTFASGEPPLQLTLADGDARKVIHFLESTSQSL